MLASVVDVIAVYILSSKYLEDLRIGYPSCLIKEFLGMSVKHLNLESPGDRLGNLYF